VEVSTQRKLERQFQVEEITMKLLKIRFEPEINKSFLEIK